MSVERDNRENDGSHVRAERFSPQRQPLDRMEAFGSSLCSSESVKDDEFSTASQSGLKSSSNLDRAMIRKQDRRSVSFGDLENVFQVASHRRSINSNAADREARQANPRQLSTVVDLEIGREDGRSKYARIRGRNERYPQLRRRRLKKQAQRLVSINSIFGGKKKREVGRRSTAGDHEENKPDTQTWCPDHVGDGDAQSRRSTNEDQQYQLLTSDTLDRSDFYEGLVSDDRNSKLNQIVISYLFWAFRSSFMTLFLSATLWFYIWTMTFALILYGIGRNNPKCIVVNSANFNSSGRAVFTDAYALSWTTFSTVGYGNVHPATSATVADPQDCIWVYVVCAWESFVGILVASVWSAIFLAKITRVSSFAQATFSVPIVIRYGKGVSKGVTDQDDSDDASLSSSKSLHAPQSNPRVDSIELSKIPCPVLEFRLMNDLHDQKHGEIIDASMNIVASVDKSQVRSSLRVDVEWRRYGGRRRRQISSSRVAGLWDEALPNRKDWDQAHKNVQKILDEHKKKVFRSMREEAELEFEPTESLAQRKLFAKVYIESQENPFFKRIWIGRHILDQYSPLLRAEVKELIKLNNSHWPQILNNADSVRASVKFDQILVSMSGTSSTDWRSVYAQNVYDYEDLCVGYNFANMFYRDKKGSLKVDSNLLNDVTEQSGGGSEGLGQWCNSGRSTPGQILIL